MYMFYLLGYKNFENLDEMLKFYEDIDELPCSNYSVFKGFGNLLKSIDNRTRKKVF